MFVWPSSLLVLPRWLVTLKALVQAPEIIRAGERTGPPAQDASVETRQPRRPRGEQARTYLVLIVEKCKQFRINLIGVRCAHTMRGTLNDLQGCMLDDCCGQKCRVSNRYNLVCISV